MTFPRRQEDYGSLKPVRNIILDWSGTLVDDLPPVLEATNSIFLRFGKPAFTRDEFREKFFLPFHEFYRIHLPELSMTELDGFYHSSFKLLQDDIPVLPQALEFLEYAREQGMPTFLLSTIHQEHFEVQAQRLGLSSYFRQAYTQAYDKRKTILQVLAEHQLSPDETLFIGDMQHDLEAAKAGGVRSCAVLTGYDSLAKLQAAQPDLLFQDLGQVQRYLERHRGGHNGSHPIATVGGLIFNHLGQVLMVQTYKWSNLWGIPGGKIKYGETSLEALRREIREETGLEVDDLQYVMVQDCIDSSEFYKPSHFLLLNYTAQARTLEVTLNDEADAWRWVTIEEAETLPLNQPTRVLLAEVRKKQSSSGDSIRIDSLVLHVHLGVPDEERSVPQKVLATVGLRLGTLSRAARGDDLNQTCDYSVLAAHLHAVAASRPRKLLETLAEDLATAVLADPRILSVTIRLEKFILPDTRCIVVEVVRGMGERREA